MAPIPVSHVDVLIVGAGPAGYGTSHPLGVSVDPMLMMLPIA